MKSKMELEYPYTHTGFSQNVYDPYLTPSYMSLDNNLLYPNGIINNMSEFFNTESDSFADFDFSPEELVGQQTEIDGEYNGFGMISCANNRKNNKNPRKPNQKPNDPNKPTNNNNNNNNILVTKDGQQVGGNNDNQNPIFFLLNLEGLEDEPAESAVVKVTPPCVGKLCDHDPLSENVPVIPDRIVNRDANYVLTLDDLIDLGMSYHCQCQTNFYSISLERLAKLVDPLIKFRQMVGMKKIKQDIVEQIVYFIQDLEPNPAEMLHTVLEGAPGLGKSHIIDILADIYLKMGYLKKNIIKKAKRSDLIGKYLGHTAVLTQKVIDEAIGGILVIDEAYSLGNAEKRDSFSKECIDTINRNLTEKAGQFICIIAGYRDELEESFFSYNPGLKSRFRYRYTMDEYNSDELMEIFNGKVENDKWSIHPDFNKQKEAGFFKHNHKSFTYFGRDMETLLFHAKVAHSNRVFFEPHEMKSKLTLVDLENAFTRFQIHTSIKDIKEKMPDQVQHMYINYFIFS